MESKQAVIKEEYNRNGGYCECGCGGLTPKAKRTRLYLGIKEGEHLRFISQHHHRGATAYNYNGHRSISHGYQIIKTKCGGKYLREHRVIAERIVGKSLPKSISIHHVNGDRSDNRNSNLVVCENEKYHKLLHRRTEALKKCGHANWRRCQFCKKYDDPKNLRIYKNCTPHHKDCFNKYEAERKQLKLF